MKIDKHGIDLLVECEGLKLAAYKCTKGTWTIGIGSTYYENGSKVKKGDKITKDEAYNLFHLTAPRYENPINKNVKVELNQHEFNALFVFCYNIGASGFLGSTVLRLVNKKAIPQDIHNAFMMWKGSDKNSKGEYTLQSRRQKEINEFFSI